MKQRKLHFSSSAFAINSAVYTDSPAGCLRNIVLQSEGISTPIQPERSLVGAVHEHLYMRRLGDQLARREFNIEDATDKYVTRRGRADFQTVDQVIHECKATFSESIKRTVIGSGKPKLTHIAQLVNYLITEKLSRGRLFYGYYEEVEIDGEIYLKLKAERGFDVEVNDAGNILIDGAIYEHDVRDLIRHTVNAIEALKNIPAVPDRPINAFEPYASPCGYCAFKNVCNDYDNDKRIDFFQAARQAARIHKDNPVKIKRSKK